MTKLKWNSVGERLFEAGVDRGVLYTKDVGAPPAPVAVGAPSATKPMLLPLRQWGVERVLWLPGAASNHASISDVNLLNADTAHIHQSKGRWVNNSGSSAAIRVTDDPLFGSGVLRVTATGISASWARSDLLAENTHVATPGQTFSCSAFIKATAGRRCFVTLDWINSAGAYISRTQAAYVVADGTWKQVSVTGVAPANAAFVVMQANIQHETGGNLTVGEYWYLDKACLRTGSDPTFVPSTRVVGDIDIRVKAAIALWTGQQALLSRYSSGRSYGLFLGGGSGTIRGAFSTDGTTSNVISTSAVIAGDVQDGQPSHIRITRASVSGTVNHYVSDDGVAWALRGSQGLTAGALSTAGGSLRLGELPAHAGYGKGAFLSFEIRDGIDGPIVASADFTNPAEVDGDSWTTPEGHTGTINRNADQKATAELIDRNVWAFPGGEQLVMPHVPQFDIGLDAQWSGFWNQFTRRNTVNSQPWLKGSLFYVPPNVYVNQGWSSSANFRVSDADGTYSTGLVSLPYQWTSGLWYINGRDISMTTSVSGIATATVAAGIEVRNEDPLRVAAPYGVGDVWALFSRLLTTAEWNELDAWDGSVANEPKWLRDDPDLVLYLNADADETVEAYEDDVVVSLHGLKPWYPDFHGIPWNGLVAVNERTVGGEVTPYYIDGIKYLNEASNEDFEATIEAFTYPEEFMQYEGIREVHNGLFATLQGKRSFGLSYRTMVGNDLEGTDHAYKIHIIYNATVVPADRNRSSLGGSIDPTNFAWTIVTKPDDFTGYKQTAHFVIDSREIPTQLLKDLEDILYGTDTTDPRLPSATELISMFETGSVEELYDIWDAGELGESVDATIDGGEL